MGPGDSPIATLANSSDSPSDGDQGFGADSIVDYVVVMGRQIRPTHMV